MTTLRVSNSQFLKVTITIIIIVLRHKIMKFIQNKTNIVSQEKLKAWYHIIKFLRNGGNNEDQIHILKNYQVEFAQIICLLKKYKRCTKICKFQPVVSPKSINSSSCVRTSRNLVKSPLTRNSNFGSFTQNALSFRHNINRRARLSRKKTAKLQIEKSDTLVENRSITTWLESEIRKVKRFAPSPRIPTGGKIFSPLSITRGRIISPNCKRKLKLLETKKMTIWSDNSVIHLNLCHLHPII